RSRRDRRRLTSTGDARRGADSTAILLRWPSTKYTGGSCHRSRLGRLRAGDMPSVDPRAGRREGRIIPFYRPDVHVEVRRLGAAAIDLLILLVLQTWINDVFGVTRLIGGPPLHRVGGGYLYVTTVTTVDVLWLALLMVLYFSVQEALFGATCGKLVAGVCV